MCANIFLKPSSSYTAHIRPFTWFSNPVYPCAWWPNCGLWPTPYIGTITPTLVFGDVCRWTMEGMHTCPIPCFPCIPRLWVPPLPLASFSSSSCRLLGALSSIAVPSCGLHPWWGMFYSVTCGIEDAVLCHPDEEEGSSYGRITTFIAL